MDKKNLCFSIVSILLYLLTLLGLIIGLIIQSVVLQFIGYGALSIASIMQIVLFIIQKKRKII